jgi:hypothetical protein
VNRFIRSMEESGDYSAAGLKRLFRRASKRVHPDLAEADGEAFLRLRQEYEEALAKLGAGGSAKGPRRRPEEARAALLRGLRRFTMKIFTKEADPLLDAMIQDAAGYDQALSALLARYRAEVYRSHSEWSGDAGRYYAHSVFISGARQLFIYYDQGGDLHKNLVRRYRESMAGWSRRIPKDFSEILEGLYSWIESEADKEALRVD